MLPPWLSVGTDFISESDARSLITLFGFQFPGETSNIMAKKKVGIALIGYAFMGKTHSNAYRQVTKFFDPDVEPEMKVLVGRNEENVKRAAAKLGLAGIRN